MDLDAPPPYHSVTLDEIVNAKMAGILPPGEAHTAAARMLRREGLLDGGSK